MERITGFLRRHRGKLIFTGIVVSAGYGIYKYAQYKLREFEQSLRDTQELHDVELRIQRISEANERACASAVQSSLPFLLEELSKRLDAEGIRDRLKSRPSNKLELWDELKVASISRLLVAVYASALLTSFSAVQLNILAGHVAATNSEPFVTSEINQYFSFSLHLVNAELGTLIEIVNSSVWEIMNKITLKQEINVDEIMIWLSEIRHLVEKNNCSRLLSLLLPSQTNEESPQLQRLLDETRDVLDSTEFLSAFIGCVSHGIGYITSSLQVDLFPLAPIGTSSIREISEEESESSFMATKKALVHAIPVLTNMLPLLLESPENAHIQELVVLDPMRALSRSVFDAFSKRGKSSD